MNIKRKKVVGIMLVLTLTMVSICGCSRNYAKNELSKKGFFAMDTYMEITLYGVEDSKDILAECVQEINRLEHLWSTGDSHSEIGLLNEQKEYVVSEETGRLWENAYRIYEMTDGAFDATIYPVMEAWGFAGGELHAPTKEEIAQKLALVDSTKVLWDKKERRLKLSDEMKLDFGGIAKGYTGSAIAEMLKEKGVNSALLNLGGNIQLVGSKPDGSDFTIGVQDPDNSSKSIGYLSASDVAIVTSGGYERNFEENGQVYHHIIDPKTGYPAYNGLKSVTIVDKDGMLADAYSTALFVLGTEEAIRFWKEKGTDFEAVFVTQDDKIYVTEGLKGHFESEKKFEIIGR